MIEHVENLKQTLDKEHEELEKTKLVNYLKMINSVLDLDHLYCIPLLMYSFIYLYLPPRQRPVTGDIAMPPIRLSVCPSACLSVRHV